MKYMTSGRPVERIEMMAAVIKMTRIGWMNKIDRIIRM